MKYTIGITTFKHRFETFFKPLIIQIKEILPDVEVIVAINGEHKEDFDTQYQKNILSFLSAYNNVFPIMYPQFRSLSKLWNNIIINSSNEYILLLNDDISINSKGVFQILEHCIYSLGTSFKINGSWSHVLLKKNEVMDVNFFPENFLGIGEEDGYFEHVYERYYNRPFRDTTIPDIINHVDMSHSPTNVREIESYGQTVGTKYSMFNKEVMYEDVFTHDEENGQRYGVCPFRLVNKNEILQQYPYEKFFLENRDRL